VFVLLTTSSSIYLSTQYKLHAAFRSGGSCRAAIGSGEGRRSARRRRPEVGCWRRPQRGGVGRWAQEADASSLREDGVGTEFSKARSRSGGA
ncbi:Os02g0807750, partial [Oryza sativa Japonica Group]